MVNSMYDAGKIARRQTDAMKGWIDNSLPFWDEVIDVDEYTGLIQISRFPGKWTAVFNRIIPEVGGYVLVLRVNDGILVMGPPPEEETVLQIAPDDPDDAEEGQLYKLLNEDDSYTVVSVVETPEGREYREVTQTSGKWNAEFSFEFGELGTSDGEFTGVRSIVVDNSGNLYVSGDDRVQKFTGLGIHISTIATAGTGDGEVSVPWGLAYQEIQGMLSVADSGNDRIVMFIDDVYVAEETGLSEPRGIAHDPTFKATRTFTTEAGNNQIQRWNVNPGPSWDFPTSWGGSGDPLLFNEPTGVAQDSLGRAWIVDTNNHMVKVYGEYGDLLFSLGSQGGGPSQFNYPEGIAIDEKGNIYVTDTGNNRVQVFNPDIVFQGYFGSLGSAQGKFNAPTGIAISNGYVYIGDSGNNRVQVFRSPTPPVVQEIAKFPLTLILSFGSLGGSPGQFLGGEIHAIAVNESTGQIYVAADDRITKFASNGTYLSTLSIPGGGSITGLAFSSTGTLFATNETTSRIMYWSSTDVYVGTLGATGSGDGEMSSPGGIAAYSTNLLYITDRDNNRVVKWNSATGLAISPYSFSSYGNQPGELNGPRGISVQSEGGLSTFFVVDTGNHRIQKWKSKLGVADPGIIMVAGSPGSGAAQLWVPRGVAVDSRGNIYVTDTENHRIMVFDSRGVFQGEYGGQGSTDETLNRPIAIAISKDYIYIGDTDNHRIQVFVNPVSSSGGEGGIGFINLWAGSIDPDGWLICDGREVNRDVYSDLFDTIGTTYGTGDGTSTFNIPNLKGSVPVGLDSADTLFDTLGETGGESSHLLTQTEGAVAGHAHSLAGGQTSVNRSTGAPAAATAGVGGSSTGTTSVSASAAHNNLQPYIVLNYVIKY